MQKLRKLRGEDDFDSFSNRFLDNFLCLGLKQAPGKTTCCFYMLLCTMYCVQVTASRKLNKHDQRTTVVQRWKLYQSWREAYVILTFWLVSWIPWIWQSPPFLDANFGKFPLWNSERLNRLGCNLLLSHYLACAHPHRKMIGTPAGWHRRSLGRWNRMTKPIRIKHPSCYAFIRVHGFSIFFLPFASFASYSFLELAGELLSQTL